MRLYLIVGVLASILFIAFIMQNTNVVSAHFLLWSFSGSLALALLLSFAFGVIISLLLAIPLVFRRRKKPTINPPAQKEVS